jgi:histidine transport system permease protein
VAVVWLYTYVFRGTPLYVQLLLYTGLYSLQIVRGTPLLDAFFRDGMLHAARVRAEHLRVHTEIFAGAIRRRRTARRARIRDVAFTMYRRVILPSALRRALPLYSNEVILMLHATTVAFTATVPDILKIARDVNSATYMSFQFGIAACSIS